MKFYTVVFFIVCALIFFEETSSLPTSDLRHKWSSDCKANKMLCCDDECPDVKYWDDFQDYTNEDNVELNQSEDVSNGKDEASYGNDPANTLEVQDEEKEAFNRLQLLTSKPVLYVCNVNEDEAVNG